MTRFTRPPTGRLARIANQSLEVRDIGEALPVVASARRFSSPQPGTVQIGQHYYPTERVANLYHRLSTPRIAGNFFEGNHLRATIGENSPIPIVEFGRQSRTVGPYSGFVTDQPSHLSVALSPKSNLYSNENRFRVGVPISRANQRRASEEAQAMRQNFGAVMFQNPEVRRVTPEIEASAIGSGLYLNTPASPARARAYQQFGFSEAPGAYHSSVQYLDNRRFRQIPSIANVLALGDEVSLDPGIASALRQRLAAGLVQRQGLPVEASTTAAANLYAEIAQQKANQALVSQLANQISNLRDQAERAAYARRGYGQAEAYGDNYFEYL